MCLYQAYNMRCLCSKFSTEKVNASVMYVSLQVFGEWILIEAFSDDEGYAEKLKMGKSSKVELRATSSDKSVLFKQGNMM